MTVPGAYALVLLALAAMRLTRLVGWDTITDGLRSRLTGYHHDGRYRSGSKILHAKGQARMAFVTCPWCAGFWITLVVWGCWQIWPHATLVAMAPLAINEIVGLTVKTLDK